MYLSVSKVLARHAQWPVWIPSPDLNETSIAVHAYNPRSARSSLDTERFWSWPGLHETQSQNKKNKNKKEEEAREGREGRGTSGRRKSEWVTVGGGRVSEWLSGRRLSLEIRHSFWKNSNFSLSIILQPELLMDKRGNIYRKNFLANVRKGYENYTWGKT